MAALKALTDRILDVPNKDDPSVSAFNLLHFSEKIGSSVISGSRNFSFR